MINQSLANVPSTRRLGNSQQMIPTTLNARLKKKKLSSLSKTRAAFNNSIDN